MAGQHLPASRHEFMFWFVVSLLAIAILLLFMQRAVGIW